MTDPAATPGHTPKGLECCRGDTCTHVLIAARARRQNHLDVCLSNLSHWCAKTGNSRKKGFLLAHSSAQEGFRCDQEAEVAGA